MDVDRNILMLLPKMEETQVHTQILLLVIHKCGHVSATYYIRANAYIFRIFNSRLSLVPIGHFLPCRLSVYPLWSRFSRPY